MDILTIFLILVALASSTISIFWTGSRWTKLTLLSLAILIACGAILQSFRDEQVDPTPPRRVEPPSKAPDSVPEDPFIAERVEPAVRVPNPKPTDPSISKGSVPAAKVPKSPPEDPSLVKNIEPALKTLDSLPSGFREEFSRVAAEIATGVGYSRVSITEYGQGWSSKRFGYVIGFMEPGATRPLTGYEELQGLTGYEHGFVYVPKKLLSKMASEFIQGRSIWSLLKGEVTWAWEESDILTERAMESMEGVISQAFGAAAGPTNQEYDFQRQPQRYQIHLKKTRKGNVSVTATGDHEGGFRSLLLGFIDREHLDKLVRLDSIARGGKIFYYVFELLLDDWNDPSYLPIIVGR